MENTVKEIIDDLEYLFRNGEIGMEVINPTYYQRFCKVLDATEIRYDLHIHEYDEDSLVVKLV
ncbi:hypothetical protein CN556_14290 [Bacillus wiedmannii]|uniref:hypothetical protein n=1 Tax=Bacillus wiedmannii TaxID=1890302 RepID=UPI000BEFB00E|nr:hypothetical protein [Bacillus wiedmannii]PEI30936.1 hypothetical protein CN644_31020 [Bacillus wiedmannii]PEM01883.1 hypothetical protein CN604_05880 [Bacillus wiedmannii]PEN95459.1 hypothetical protein CN556_14290 [Bacillus wiedmannii]PFY99577.1 hypothetical protein COL75_22830 [Bacillus wiedmannii]